MDSDKEKQAPADGNGKCLEIYKNSRQRYIALCTRYGLNPFDLDILSMCVSRLPKNDKVELVRLILKLIRLERLLKEDLEQMLFPLTVLESERSGYLVPSFSHGGGFVPTKADGPDNGGGRH